jgi:hypothetical protein
MHYYLHQQEFDSHENEQYFKKLEKNEYYQKIKSIINLKEEEKCFIILFPDNINDDIGEVILDEYAEQNDITLVLSDDEDDPYYYNESFLFLNSLSILNKRTVTYYEEYNTIEIKTLLDKENNIYSILYINTEELDDETKENLLSIAEKY